MTQLSGKSYTAYIGIDWASNKHDLCMQLAGSEERTFECIKHTPEAIEEWAQALYQPLGGPIAVALELSEGPIVSALQKYDFLVLFPIDPKRLANYRQAFVPSGAKDDPTDAEFAMDYLMRHPEKLKVLKLESAAMRKLRYVVEARDRIKGDQSRYVNRVIQALKQYYPQAVDWFNDHNTLVFCDFLKQWPTLTTVQRARKTRLERFFKEHNVRFARVIEDRIQAMKCFDEQITAFGEDRDRYSCATQVQKRSSIAPITKRSGNSTWVHWRFQCPKFLRQTFIDFAAQTINKSAWAGAYYRQQRAKGASHNMAVRALAYKWIRVLYRCWQERTPYDESKYLETLRRRGSPPLKQLAEAA